MRLTPHFELEEFTQSSTALRLGIDNTPGPEVVKRLKVVAEKLEVIRQAAFLQSNAIIISSGYRSPHLNLVVGGSKNSAHIWGWAADIKVRGFTALELARIMEEASSVERLVSPRRSAAASALASFSCSFVFCSNPI